MTTWDKITYIFCILIIGIVLGYAWRMEQEKAFLKDMVNLHQLEADIKTQLTLSRQPFWIKDTSIQITPWWDGSGVIRIKERQDEN